MRRWTIAGLVLLAVLLIVGAAYLGLRGTRRRVDPGDTASPPVVAVTRGDVQETVIAPGVLVDAQVTTLSSRIGGWLAEVLVRPGDHVRAGEPMATLQVDDLHWQIAQAQGELDSALLALSLAERARIDQIARLQLDLAAAQATVSLAKAEHADTLSRAEHALSVAQEQYARLQAQEKEVTAQHTVAGIDLAEAEDVLAQAQVAYAEALDRPWEPQAVRDAAARALLQAQRARTVAQARHDQADAAQRTYRHDLNLQRLAVAEAKAEQARLADRDDPASEIELQRVQQQLEELDRGVDPLLAQRARRAQRELDHLRELLSRAEVRAPIESVVLEVWARVGDAVSPGTALLLLADPAAAEVQTTVIEEDVPLLRAGQPAELFFDARPDALAQGTVTRIVPRRVQGEDRPLYHVYLAPVGPLPQGVYPGMTVDASIVIARVRDVLRLPRAVVRARSDGTALVQIWLDGRAIERSVRVGLRGDVYVEILEGLRLGDEVLGE